MKLAYGVLAIVACISPINVINAAGVPTHQFMADRAIEALDSAEDATLRRLLEVNRQTVLSGAGFPDSGYAQGIVTAGQLPNYGELAHWDHFIQGYTRYIQSQCSETDLAFSTDASFTSSCAILVAHAMGVAAHGIGDETWDVLFEPVYLQQDGPLTGTLSEVTTASNIPPSIREPLLGNVPMLAQILETTQGLRNSIPSDVTATFEYQMDVAVIAEYDRYDDIQIPEAVSSNRDLPIPVQSLLDSFYRSINDLAAPPQQVPVASLPDTLTLADIANLACDPATYAPSIYSTSYTEQRRVPDCHATPYIPGQFGIGLSAGTALLLAETLVAPYESQRVRDQSPWASNNFLLNSGGITQSAFAIKGYWKGLLARLRNQYENVSIVSVHPLPGEKNVTLRSVSIGDGDLSDQDTRGLIGVMLDNEFDWTSVRGTGDFSSPVLTLTPLGETTAITGSFRATYFNSGNVTVDEAAGNRGRRQFWFIPEQTLQPNTTYLAQVSTQLQDHLGNRLQTPYRWSFTTGDAPE